MSAASTSALSALLSSLNNGSSGLDVTSAVNEIIYADAAPERVWQSDQTTLGNQSTEIQQLETEAGNLSTALQNLSDITGAFASVTASSSNSAVAASAISGAATGAHTIAVSQLATTGSWYSDEESSATATLPAGSFTITQGANTQTFSTGSGTGDNLKDLATAINAAGLGVTASVVTDANGARLSLVAANSGSAADFSVSDSSGVAFTQAVQAQDAQLTVDGVPVTSASNTVTGAIPDVTLNLQGLTGNSPATIQVNADTSSIDSALSSFVSAYNTLIKDLNGQFTFSTTSGSEGVLASDSVARSMQSDVLAASNLSIGSGTFNTLASLGINTNKDGSLTLNTSTLNSALASNYDAVANFFQGTTNADGTTSQGFSSTLLNTLNGYTDPIHGAYTVDLSSISNETSALQDEIDQFNIYLANQQTLLTTEYNNANIALQQLPSKIKNVQTLLGENSSGSSSS